MSSKRNFIVFILVFISIVSIFVVFLYSYKKPIVKDTELQIIDTRTNRMLSDNDYYNKAIIKLPNDEIININVQVYKNCAYNDRISILSDDGIWYETSYVNCILIRDSK